MSADLEVAAAVQRTALQRWTKRCGTAGRMGLSLFLYNSTKVYLLVMVVSALYVEQNVNALSISKKERFVGSLDYIGDFGRNFRDVPRGSEASHTAGDIRSFEIHDDDFEDIDDFEDEHDQDFPRHVHRRTKRDSSSDSDSSDESEEEDSHSSSDSDEKEEDKGEMPKPPPPRPAGTNMRRRHTPPTTTRRCRTRRHPTPAPNRRRVTAPPRTVGQPETATLPVVTAPKQENPPPTAPPPPTTKPCTTTPSTTSENSVVSTTTLTVATTTTLTVATTTPREESLVCSPGLVCNERPLLTDVAKHRYDILAEIVAVTALTTVTLAVERLNMNDPPLCYGVDAFTGRTLELRFVGGASAIIEVNSTSLPFAISKLDYQSEMFAGFGYLRLSVDPNRVGEFTLTDIRPEGAPKFVIYPPVDMVSTWCKLCCTKQTIWSRFF